MSVLWTNNNYDVLLAAVVQMYVATAFPVASSPFLHFLFGPISSKCSFSTPDFQTTRPKRQNKLTVRLFLLDGREGCELGLSFFNLLCKDELKKSGKARVTSSKISTRNHCKMTDKAATIRQATLFPLPPTSKPTPFQSTEDQSK